LRELTGLQDASSQLGKVSEASGGNKAVDKLPNSASSARDAGAARCFDDPWSALDHLDDLWACFAGLPPDADAAPDVTSSGWLRLTVAGLDDSNRSRHATDPAWLVVQQARFGASVPEPLARVPAVRHDLNRVDAELYGLLKLRAALRGEYLEETATLGLEVRKFVTRMEDMDAEKGRDFAEEVREKARRMGKPVPIRRERLVCG
jgi:hypothetical protein